MASPSSVKPLYWQAVDAFDDEAAFVDWLRDQREGHQSYEGIMFALIDKTGLRVNGETVRRWCIRHGIQ